MAQTQTALPRVERKGLWDRIWEALDERLALHALAYPVPEYANTIPYVLGGITLVGFGVLFATGVLLTQFYHPHPDAAHDSVVYIITQAPFGDLIRSVHFWTANLVVITALLHMIRTYYTASFKRPRELNWLVGVGLLAITLGFVFTGTVLKWDQEASEALAHNKEIAEMLGVWGVWFSSEWTRSIPLLTRIYSTHITLLPFILLGLVAVHLFLIKMLKISPQPTKTARAGDSYPPGEKMARFDIHLRRMIGFGLILFAAIVILSFFVPAPLGLKAVPGEEVTKPPWMLLWLYPIEDVLGVGGIIYGGIAFFGLLALVPFIDRNLWLAPSKRRAMLIAGAVVLLVLAALIVYAFFTVPVTHTLEGVP
ncbi:MAG: cytochrome b N-terminal domain-containing protein [Chloroflexi bacterium]|nr:cytochrome b N-terminal domain-containing protein [Chloroflexota bacterium]